MASNTSSLCEHAHFARNGTTYSARKMKYIVHCASHSDQDGEYLTPTQRANRSIRRLRTLLAEAQAEIMDKENEIMRLTKELVEIRLNKASPDMKDGQDGADGKHCDDLKFRDALLILRFLRVRSLIGGLAVVSVWRLYRQCNGVNGRDGVGLKRCENPTPAWRSKGAEDFCAMRLITYSFKGGHGKTVILMFNLHRFYELKPQYDSAALRVKELEKENADLKKSMKEQEDLHQSMVTLYAKEKQGLVEAVQKSNQTNEKSNQANQTDSVITPVHHTLAPTPSPVPPPKSVADENVPKILQELEITRRELEEIKVKPKSQFGSFRTSAFLGIRPVEIFSTEKCILFFLFASNTFCFLLLQMGIWRDTIFVLGVVWREATR
ncbi:uncharacterized protein LOC103511183 [Diaphorina citri]|uniref:Uncharacterized protein LOC103511183 n=1 Tax=Diaphorina citri TaxID=121845 RepID=A0A3Q0IX58_DIACI|nr:uncharacterized protein LOC103511183 [Diaphorina citri]